MTRFKIYVEGGSSDNHLKTRCRRAFRKFFEKSGLGGRMPRIIASGSRNEAFDDFKTALETCAPGETVLLLVDSESRVGSPDTVTPWDHLHRRDHWERPAGATDDQCHLMVQCMENWFLADPECLKAYWGNRFNKDHLPGNPRPEEVPKGDVFAALKRASRNTSKGAYGKGKDSFSILEKLDPHKVYEVSPWAKRLRDAL